MLRQSECSRVPAYVQEPTNNQCQSKRRSGLANDTHGHQEGFRFLAATFSVRVNKRLTRWLSITRMSAGYTASESPESGEGKRARNTPTFSTLKRSAVGGSLKMEAVEDTLPAFKE